MKSTLRIAAAGACLSVFSFSPALAATPPSSSVQLYGLIDTGLQYINNGPGGNSKTGMSTGNLSGSRWGLRGTEDPVSYTHLDVYKRQALHRGLATGLRAARPGQQARQAGAHGPRLA